MDEFLSLAVLQRMAAHSFSLLLFVLFLDLFVLLSITLQSGDSSGLSTFCLSRELLDPALSMEGPFHAFLVLWPSCLDLSY